MSLYTEHSAVRRLFTEAGLVSRSQRQAFVRQAVGRDDVEPVGRRALTVAEVGQVVAALHRRINGTVPETTPACPWCGQQPCPQEFDHTRLHAGAETTWRAS